MKSLILVLAVGGMAVVGWRSATLDERPGTPLGTSESATSGRALLPWTAASRASGPGDPGPGPQVDGMELVFVPAGDFLMGSPDDDPEAWPDQQPQRAVYLDAYWIDRTEVTNAMFEQFVEATGHNAGSYWRIIASGKPDHPVVYMNWFDADAYCEWAGRSLPTEAQWEKAARGTDGRKYPWGNEPPDEGRCNFYGNEGGTTAVGSYPAGASPYGALDMAGNVWELVADWYDSGYYAVSPRRNPPGPSAGEYRVLRGGSWFDVARLVRSSSRLNGPPVLRIDFFGFRCALP